MPKGKVAPKGLTYDITSSFDDNELEEEILEEFGEYQKNAILSRRSFKDPTMESFYSGMEDNGATSSSDEGNLAVDNDNVSMQAAEVDNGTTESTRPNQRKAAMAETEETKLSTVLFAKRVGRAWRSRNAGKSEYLHTEDVRFRKRKSKDIQLLQATLNAGLPVLPECEPDSALSRAISKKETLHTARRESKSGKNRTAQDEEGIEVSHHWCSIETLFILFMDPIGIDSVVKSLWDFIVLLVSIFAVIQVPLTIAFATQDPFQAADVFVDFVLIIDIWLSSRMVFLDHQNVEVYSLPQIRRKYLREWFALDFVAALPMDRLVTLDNPQYQTFLRWNRTVRVVRLLDRLSKSASGGFARIIKLLFLFVLSAHFFACAFLVIGRMQHEDTVGGRWIDNFRVVEYPDSDQYLVSLYWTFATLGTVGYGDVTATSTLERTFACAVMLLGSVIYATIFGTLTTLITNLDRNKNRYNDKVSMINEFCSLNNLPTFIQHRLRAYVDATWAMRKGLSVTQVLEGVPPIVKSELLMYMYADLMREVPMFSLCDRRFLEKVVNKFQHQVFLMGDFMIREGDPGEQLFFILNGYCDIRKYKTKARHGEDEEIHLQDLYAKSIFIAQRGPGSFVGEGALLQGGRRGASVICTSSIVQSMYLLKEDFDEVATEHPEVRRALESANQNKIGKVMLSAKKVKENKGARGKKTNFSKRIGHGDTRSFTNQMLNALEKDVRHHGGIKLQTSSRSLAKSDSVTSQSGTFQNLHANVSVDGEAMDTLPPAEALSQVLASVRTLQKLMAHKKPEASFASAIVASEEGSTQHLSPLETDVKVLELEEKLGSLQTSVDQTNKLFRDFIKKQEGNA